MKVVHSERSGGWETGYGRVLVRNAAFPMKVFRDVAGGQLSTGKNQEKNKEKTLARGTRILFAYEKKSVSPGIRLAAVHCF